MADISAQLVKQLRDKTGVGFMECKKALVEANGDVAEAEVVLRKRGVSVAAKKAGREANEGLIEAYIHPGAKLGVLLELNCESDFVARTDQFQELARDIAMHVAATAPRFVRREEVDEAAMEKEREIQRARALAEGKPEKIVDKIVEGRMSKFYEEVVLLEQPFVKDNSKTVQDLLTETIAKLGENITVGRVVRYKIGEES
ncbi:MAG: translation elongation factor Ts [Acidobacteria bacterium]|nr:translation elongation factor Ts [Acidobacteriota bacterium]